MENDIYKKKNIISGIVWKFIERGASVIVSLAVTVVLSRILEPSDYGVVAIVTVFVSLSQILVTAGLGNALIQKKDSDELDFSTMLWVNLAIALVIYMLLFVFAPFIASFYSYKELTGLLRVLSLIIIVMALNSIQVAYVSKRMLFKNYFFSTLSSKILSGVIGVVMAVWGFGCWALVGQVLSQRIIETIVLWIRVKWKPQLKFSLERAKPLYSFAWKLMLTSFIESIRDQIRNLIIGKACSSEELAFYDKGTLFPNTIITNSLSSLSAVMFPVLSNCQNDEEKHIRTMRKWIGLLAFCVFPILTELACIGDSLFEIVFTSKWLPAVPFLRICCFTYAVWVIEVPIRETIKSKGFAGICLFMQFAKSIIAIVSILVTMKYGVMAIAYSAVVCGGVNICISSYFGKKILKYSPLLLISDLYKTVISCLFVIAICNSIGFLNLSKIPLIIMQILCSIGIYILLAIVTKNEYLSSIIRLVKKK